MNGVTVNNVDIKQVTNENDVNSINNSLVSIHRKLDYFIMTGKIPNIIFHGAAGTGKKTIVFNFIDKIYKPINYIKDQDNSNGRCFRNILKNNVMLVNCCHGKGIKFIREELKFFSKMNIQYTEGISFKSVVLFNADCLTIDAQSALRRCIELFSHNTRFFIVVENIHKLLNPIVSRFCEIYVPETIIYKNASSIGFSQLCDNNTNTNISINVEPLSQVTPELSTTQFINFYQLELQKTIDKSEIEHKNRKKSIIIEKLKIHDNDNIKISMDSNKTRTPTESIHIVDFFYENGISALDIIEYLEEKQLLTNDVLLDFHKIKRNYRNEKLLMFRILWMLNI